MLQFHHRDPHLVGLLASDNIPNNRCIYYGMISDGIHGHGAAIRIAYRTHPKGIKLEVPMGADNSNKIEIIIKSVAKTDFFARSNS